MIIVPFDEAKTRLSELLHQAQRGEEVTITRHGVPVARLVPPATVAGDVAANQRQAVAAVFESLAALRQGVTLDMPLREAVEQGRD